jgi:hypothetical protein
MLSAKKMQAQSFNPTKRSMHPYSIRAGLHWSFFDQLESGVKKT